MNDEMENEIEVSGEENNSAEEDASALKRNETEIPPAEAPKKESSKKRKTKKAAHKLKLSKFDCLFMQLLNEGKSGVSEIISLLNVDSHDFHKRLATLIRRKYVVPDSDFRTVRLSVKGIGEYKPEWRKYADKFFGREERTIVPEKPAPPDPAQTVLEVAEKPALPVSKNAENENEKHEHMDISELMRKFGPTEAQAEKFGKTKSPFVERHVGNGNNRNGGNGSKNEEAGETLHPVPISKNNIAREKGKLQKTEPVPSPQKEAPSRSSSSSGEICELCRDKFSISVKPSENKPKYGHCFCGAAYHRDCYEGILQTDSRCVKCGRKLVLALDLKAEEAVREIKDVFE